MNINTPSLLFNIQINDVLPMKKNDIIWIVFSIIEIMSLSRGISELQRMTSSKNLLTSEYGSIICQIYAFVHIYTWFSCHFMEDREKYWLKCREKNSVFKTPSHKREARVSSSRRPQIGSKIQTIMTIQSISYNSRLSNRSKILPFYIKVLPLKKWFHLSIRWKRIKIQSCEFYLVLKSWKKNTTDFGFDFFF